MIRPHVQLEDFATLPAYLQLQVTAFPVSIVQPEPSTWSHALQAIFAQLQPCRPKLRALLDHIAVQLA
jgi:DNA-binding helix-hairpin-helix protein with protein kinase domain